MSDFYLVIDYFFVVFKQVWNLIVNNWVLGIFLAISIFSFIVGLYLQILGKGE